MRLTCLCSSSRDNYSCKSISLTFAFGNASSAQLLLLLVFQHLQDHDVKSPSPDILYSTNSSVNITFINAFLCDLSSPAVSRNHFLPSHPPDFLSFLPIPSHSSKKSFIWPRVAVVVCLYVFFIFLKLEVFLYESTSALCNMARFHANWMIRVTYIFFTNFSISILMRCGCFVFERGYFETQCITYTLWFSLFV